MESDPELVIVMETAISTLPLVLGLKVAMSWPVLLVQRRHLLGSLAGALSLSLAIADTLMVLTFTALLLLGGDVGVMGVRLTRHHICLLLQIVCCIYGALHWPSLIAMVISQCWALPTNVLQLQWVKVFARAATVCALWVGAALYGLSAFSPTLSDEPHYLLESCQVYGSTQSSQVASTALLTLAAMCAWHLCVYALTPTEAGKGPATEQKSSYARPPLLGQILPPFLSTWVTFLILLLSLLALWPEIAAFLDMNVPWLCFLNSFAVTVVLCGRGPSLRYCKDLTVTDGFCCWRFGFQDENKQ